MTTKLNIIHEADSVGLTQKEQIIKLMSEVKCKLAPSPINGIGVFAIMDIKKGERCFCVPGLISRKFYTVPWGSLSKLFPEQKELIVSRWSSIINGSAFTSPNDDTWMILFMNHSSDPMKVNYDIRSDEAIRDIPKNTELLEDYKVMRNWEKVWPPEKNPWIN